MAQKLYKFKVSMVVKSTTDNWIDIKKGVNCCMNCGIVNELTNIKEVRYIKPLNRKGEE